MTLIIGADGSMGKRYQAILAYASEPFECLDLKNIEDGPTLLAKAKRVIIATPTDTHFNLLSLVAPYKIPILCEKPLTKSKEEIHLIAELKKKHDMDLTMMMQYSKIYLLKNPPSRLADTRKRESHYDYFRHGSDGLCWDCLQIIALHSGPLEKLSLRDKKPVWTCMIDGAVLRSSEMDAAYVNFTEDWIRGGARQSMEYLIEIHDKVREYEAHCAKTR